MAVRRSLILLSVLSILLPFAVFSLKAGQLQQQNTQQNLQYYTVDLGELNVVVNAIGTVEAKQVANLSFSRAERVIEVLVAVGDFVQTGDVLARQASETEQNAYERALLALQLAEIRKQDLIEPADVSEILIAEANLDSAWGTYLGLQNAVSPEDLAAAQLKYEQAEAAYEAAVDARFDANADQPEEVYQLLDAQVGSASFNMEIARLQLESLQAGNSGALSAAYARVIQAQAVLTKLEAGPTAAEIDQADIAIQQAQADVDDAQRALDRMALVAPFSGLISAVNIEIGIISTPALTAIEITDLSELYVDAEVDEVDIRHIKEGMSAKIRLDALPTMSFSGVLQQIALVETNDNGIISYDVKVALGDTDLRVRVGMTADASVIVEQRERVVVVPNLYIRLNRTTGEAFVNHVLPDGTLEETEVILGLQGQDSSEIVDGLGVGDVIAVDLSGDRFAAFGG